MSRIWKLPVSLPSWVTAKIENNTVTVTWPKGTLSFNFVSEVGITQEDNSLSINLIDKEAIALWGTTRAIVANLVVWVTEWFKKSLEISGVGYKFEIQWQKLVLSVGFSHKVEKNIPSDIQVVFDEKAKNVIHITWIDKQRVGQFASQVKMIKKPEPYKGKWIKYQGEHIRRKAGKSGKK